MMRRQFISSASALVLAGCSAKSAVTTTELPTTTTMPTPRTDTARIREIVRRVFSSDEWDGVQSPEIFIEERDGYNILIEYMYDSTGNPVEDESTIRGVALKNFRELYTEELPVRTVVLTAFVSLSGDSSALSNIALYRKTATGINWDSTSPADVPEISDMYAFNSNLY